MLFVVPFLMVGDGGPIPLNSCFVEAHQLLLETHTTTTGKIRTLKLLVGSLRAPVGTESVRNCLSPTLEEILSLPRASAEFC